MCSFIVWLLLSVTTSPGSSTVLNSLGTTGDFKFSVHGGIIWRIKDTLHSSLVNKQRMSTLWGASAIRSSSAHFQLERICESFSAMNPIFFNLYLKQNREPNPHTVWKQINILLSAFTVNHIRDPIETLGITNSHSYWAYLQYRITKAQIPVFRMSCYYTSS